MDTSRPSSRTNWTRLVQTSGAQEKTPCMGVLEEPDRPESVQTWGTWERGVVSDFTFRPCKSDFAFHPCKSDFTFHPCKRSHTLWDGDTCFPPAVHCSTCSLPPSPDAAPLARCTISRTAASSGLCSSTCPTTRGRSKTSSVRGGATTTTPSAGSRSEPRRARSARPRARASLFLFCATRRLALLPVF